MQHTKGAVVEYPPPRHGTEFVAVIKDSGDPTKTVVVVAVYDDPDGPRVTVTVREPAGPTDRPDGGWPSPNAVAALPTDALEAFALVALEAQQACDRIERRWAPLGEAA